MTDRSDGERQLPPFPTLCKRRKKRTTVPIPQGKCFFTLLPGRPGLRNGECLRLRVRKKKLRKSLTCQNHYDDQDSHRRDAMDMLTAPYYQTKRSCSISTSVILAVPSKELLACSNEGTRVKLLTETSVALRRYRAAKLGGFPQAIDIHFEGSMQLNQTRAVTKPLKNEAGIECFVTTTVFCSMK